jgi:hypothetical protein
LVYPDNICLTRASAMSFRRLCSRRILPEQSI